MVFISSLGSSWLEANLPTFLSLLMDLARHPKATQTAVEAAVTRCCVSFILRSTLGSLLGEKAQTMAAKQLSLTVAAHKPTAGESLKEGQVPVPLWSWSLYGPSLVLVHSWSCSPSGSVKVLYNSNALVKVRKYWFGFYIFIYINEYIGYFRDIYSIDISVSFGAL